MTGITDVLDFWFREVGPSRWYDSSEALDSAARVRFGALHEAAAEGALDAWRETPEGSLALILLLDQLPRNMFRGAPRAYATDSAARAAAREAIARGYDLAVPEPRRRFFYLPLEHSEDLGDQERCLALAVERVEDPDFVAYARRHHDVIARFGRFPHRNRILGRASTPEEESFLRDVGAGW